MGIQINGSTDRITAIDGTIDFVSNIGNIGLITASNYVLQDSITIGAGSTIIKTVNGKLGIGEDAPTRNLHIDGTAHQSGIIIHTAGNHSTAIDMDSNRSSAAGGLAELNFKWNGTTVGQIGAYAGSDTSNKDDGHIHFGTASAGSIVERLRITSGGNLLVHKTTTSDYGKFEVKGGTADDIETADITAKTIATFSGSTPGTTAAGKGAGIVIKPIADRGCNYFIGVANDSTNQEAHGRFIIRSGNFAGQTVERLRIRSDGTVDIGSGTHSRNLTVHAATNSVILIEGASNGTSNLMFGDENDEDVGMLGYNHASNYLAFTVNTAERLRIDSNGVLTTKQSSTNASSSNWNGAIFSIQNTHDTDNNSSVVYFMNSATGVDCAIQGIHEDAAGTGAARRGHIQFGTSGANSSGSCVERLRIHSDGKISTKGITNPQGVFCIDTGSGATQGNTLELRRASTSDYHAVSFFTGTTCNWSIGQNNAGDFEIFEYGSDSYTRLSVHTGGTVQVQNHLTSRNGIVQIKQVTSSTRYAGSSSSVDLITGSTFTPKTSDPRFLIMIFCPVNNSDDSDAGNQNTNYYNYGRLEYRKNGGSWLECNDQGSTTEQGGYAAHIELSPNRTGDNTSDYWSGNRYRTESKTATILVTNVGDCGASGNVQFKLRCYSYSGNFIQIGQPHGNGTDDNYGVQPWGFTVFELAPDNNSYTAY